MADERGSVIAVADSSGNPVAINRAVHPERLAQAASRRDEFGIPASTNLGRIQYTGQMWLTELGMYNYKHVLSSAEGARIYSPTLGRFMQTDPIGYADGLNWYNYIGGDPVNKTDPTGISALDIIVDGKPTRPQFSNVPAIGSATFQAALRQTQLDIVSLLDFLFKNPLASSKPSKEDEEEEEKPKREKPGRCSAAVQGLLGNKAVRSAISKAVKLGLSTPNWGGGHTRRQDFGLVESLWVA